MRGEEHLFGEGSVLRDEGGRFRDRRELYRLGGALGSWGQVALGGFGPGSEELLRPVAQGVRDWGGCALSHVLECPAQGNWAVRNFGLDGGLFLQCREEGCFLHLCARDGLPLERGEEKRIEELLHHPTSQAPGGSTGHIQCSVGDYVRDGAAKTALSRFRLHRVSVAVPGDLPEERAMRRLLQSMGCTVVNSWKRGIPAFGAERGGFVLTAQDERGTLLEGEQLLPLLCLLEMEQGRGEFAVPHGASAAAELVAAGFGGKCLRLGRDGRWAREMYADQPWLWDAVWAAGRICSRMSVTGEGLEELMVKTPRFSVRRREVPLHSDQRRVLRELARRHQRELTEEGLRLRTGNGWVYLAPHRCRQALRVVAESRDMELADELCGFYVQRISQTDRALFRQDAQRFPEN